MWFLEMIGEEPRRLRIPLLPPKWRRRTVFFALSFCFLSFCPSESLSFFTLLLGTTTTATACLEERVVRAFIDNRKKLCAQLTTVTINLDP